MLLAESFRISLGDVDNPGRSLMRPMCLGGFVVQLYIS
jgi:hypothetical protein